jgi:hypothetical protein
MYPINSCDVMTTRWRLLVVEESVNWNIRVAIRSRTYVENFVETPSETSRIRMNLRNGERSHSSVDDGRAMVCSE